MVARENYKNVIAHRIDFNMAVVLSANVSQMFCFKTIFDAFIHDGGDG